jgi:hypothetical protein
MKATLIAIAALACAAHAAPKRPPYSNGCYSNGKDWGLYVGASFCELPRDGKQIPSPPFVCSVTKAKI